MKRGPSSATLRARSRASPQATRYLCSGRRPRPLIRVIGSGIPNPNANANPNTSPSPNPNQANRY